MDDKIIELTKLVESEPLTGINQKEIDIIASKHGSPWRSQSGTFWDRLKIIAFLGFATVIVVLAIPLLFSQSTAGPAKIETNRPGQSTDNRAEVVNNPQKGLESGTDSPTPQPQKPATGASDESLANAISLIDNILAEPTDLFELTELE